VWYKQAWDDEMSAAHGNRGLDWEPSSAPNIDRMGDPTPVPVAPGTLAKELARRLTLQPEPPTIPSPVSGPFAADPSLEQPEVRTAQLNRILLGMSSGQRIRNLRAALGWTQRVAAKELGVSLRTVIRHEKGHRRVLWLRLPLLRRLCELEREHADQIIAYLDYRGPERA
jgi:DNA-binding XRE family transcriptional regulator